MPGSTAEQSPTRRFAEREHANNPVAKAHAAKSNDFCGILQNEFKHFLDAPHWYAAPRLAVAGAELGRLGYPPLVADTRQGSRRLSGRGYYPTPPAFTGSRHRSAPSATSWPPTGRARTKDNSSCAAEPLWAGNPG